MGESVMINKLVPNNAEHWEFIRELRNDLEIQKGFVEQVCITEEEEKKYMEKYNDNYYICLRGGVQVGFIGEVDNDIRIAVRGDYQRLGIGEMMVREFMLLRPDSRPKILKQNLTSQRLFEKCGFKRSREDKLFYYYEKDHKN